jgi:hypothetical protein
MDSLGITRHKLEGNQDNSRESLEGFQVGLVPGSLPQPLASLSGPFQKQFCMHTGATHQWRHREEAVTFVQEMEGKIEIFCYLLMEEFLMKKNLTNTLNEFREEWISRPDEVLNKIFFFGK